MEMYTNQTRKKWREREGESEERERKRRERNEKNEIKIKWKYSRGYGIHLHSCVCMWILLIWFASRSLDETLSTYLCGTTLRTIFPNKYIYALCSLALKMDAKFNTHKFSSVSVDIRATVQTHTHTHTLNRAATYH